MSWILGNWVRLMPWLAGGGLLIGGWAYVGHQRDLIAGLEQRLVVASANGALLEKMARGNAAALDMAVKQHVVDGALVQAHFKRQVVADKVTAGILESIDHAPMSDDGPVAPVLVRAFDCLRQRDGGAAGTASSDCAADGSGGAAGMPRRP